MRAMKVIQNNLWVLKRLWKCERAYIILSVIVTILIAADQVICNAYLIRFIYNALVNGQPFYHILIALGATGVLLTARFSLRAYVEESLKPRAQTALCTGIQTDLMACARRADLSDYDDPAYYRDTVWAMENADRRAMEVFDTAIHLFSILLTAGGFASLVLVVDPYLLPLAIAYAASSFGFSMRHTGLQFKLDESNREGIGRMRYADRVFLLPQYAKELRATGIGLCIRNGFQKATVSLRDNGIRYGKPRAALMLMEDVISEQLILNIGVYGRLIWRLLGTKDIGVGDFLAASFSVEQITWRLGDLLRVFPDFIKNSLYIGQVRAFLEKESVIRNRPDALEAPSSPAAIELKNVSFTYPGADRPVLNGVNLCIRPGEKIALVGVNGAGKSTLTKLLLRLYEPDEGSIELGGLALERYHLDRLREYIGAVRQDFQLYAVTLAENVAMDDPPIHRYGGLERALTQAGMGEYFTSLPYGLKHEVTREFDERGALFSGGEAQKIALSRLFAAMPQICLLDEPSAALDPIAEAELNRAMLSAAHEKTVILISHRLSTTRFCDRIVLIENGCIAEQGSHDELIALGGEYARMFAAQAGRYR